MKKKFVCVLLAALFLCAGCAAQEETPRRTVVGFYFDTVVTLNAYVSDKGVLDRALEKCGEYEALLSKTAEGSDVWNINHAGGQPVTVSEDTLSILRTAKTVADLSGGAFDVTVASAVALWDFTGENNVLPDANALAAAAAQTDYTKIIIEGDQVTLPADMRIDLGGVAKGYIADRIADFLRDEGVESAILNFGGNVIALGGKEDDAPWRVGIQDPQEPTGNWLFVVSARDVAVVTSGIYERGFDLDGVRYHHLLDPKTGWPVQNELASVTIITKESAIADALSTAVFVLGAEEGLKLIEARDDAEAIFITRDGQIWTTPGARALVV